MNYTSILLQEAAPSAGGNSYQTLIMMVVIIAIFYFFMIRPQQKKAKEAKKFREELQAGDKVVTIGGIHGKILEVSDNTLLLQCDGATKIRVEKSAVTADMGASIAQTK